MWRLYSNKKEICKKVYFGSFSNIDYEKRKPLVTKYWEIVKWFGNTITSLRNVDFNTNENTFFLEKIEFGFNCFDLICFQFSITLLSCLYVIVSYIYLFEKEDWSFINLFLSGSTTNGCFLISVSTLFKVTQLR